MKKKAVADSKTLSDVIVAGLQEKKGQDILRMDLRKVRGAIADFFVIATGTSDKHVEAVAAAAEDMVREKLGEKPFSSEGFREGQWVLLDYVNVIVHVFQADKRDFYNIEDLWADAVFEKIPS